MNDDTAVTHYRARIPVSQITLNSELVQFELSVWRVFGIFCGETWLQRRCWWFTVVIVKTFDDFHTSAKCWNISIITSLHQNLWAVQINYLLYYETWLQRRCCWNTLVIIVKTSACLFWSCVSGGNHDADCENEANHNENTMKSSIMN